MNRDIDNEAQALAAEAAGRGGRGGAGAAGQPVTVQIDWNNIARRARQLTVPGDTLGGLVASPEGHSVAFNLSTGGGRGGGGAAAGGGTAGIYVINVETAQLTRVPPASEAGAAGGGRGGGRGGGGGGAGGAGKVFSRDGRTLYFQSGSGLYAASVPAGGGAAGGPAAGGGRGGAGRGGGGGAAAATQEPAGGGGTARQVTYTATIQIDRKALRTQVFNEGWRIMKNRFYDVEMHGINWASLQDDRTSRS